MTRAGSIRLEVHDDCVAGLPSRCQLSATLSSGSGVRFHRACRQSGGCEIRRRGLVGATVAIPVALVGVLLGPAWNSRAGTGFAPTVNYPVTETRPSAGWGGELDGSYTYPDFAFADAAGGRVGVIVQMLWPWDTSAVYFPVGNNPRSIAGGDFSGDGHDDLATANAGSNNVSVLINGGPNGLGKSFAPAVNYAVGTNPVFVVAGDILSTNPGAHIPIDFNHDGKRDIVAVNRASNSVSVLLGNGNGTFQGAHSYASGTDPVAAAANDLNGDGATDLVVANNSADSYTVLLANGGGGFNAGASHALSAGSHPTVVGLADLNGDGKVDLVIANGGSGNVSVLMGSGNGTFGAATNYATGPGPNSIALRDVDGNYPSYDFDIVVTNAGANTVSVLLGNGDGAYRPAVNYATGANPSSVTTFNDSGAWDLAVTDYDGKDVSIFQKVSGSSSYGAAVKQIFGADPSGGLPSDLNNDGKPDMAGGNNGAAKLLGFVGNGNGSFATARDFSTGAGTAPQMLVAGDFNGDGKPDLATVDRDQNDSTDSVSVLMGKGDGTFGPPALYRVGPNHNVRYYPVWVAGGDFN